MKLLRMLGLLSCLSMSFAYAEPTGLLGGWELKSFMIVSPSGDRVEFCPGAFGKIIYEANGYVSVAINCGLNVPPGSPAEAIGGMLFYSGNFVIQNDSVIHQITNASVPNMIGTSAVRKVKLSSRKLILTGKYGSQGQTIDIEWFK